MEKCLKIISLCSDSVSKKRRLTKKPRSLSSHKEKEEPEILLMIEEQIKKDNEHKYFTDFARLKLQEKSENVESKIRRDVQKNLQRITKKNLSFDSETKKDYKSERRKVILDYYLNKPEYRERLLEECLIRDMQIDYIEKMDKRYIPKRNECTKCEKMAKIQNELILTKNLRLILEKKSFTSYFTDKITEESSKSAYLGMKEKFVDRATRMKNERTRNLKAINFLVDTREKDEINKFFLDDDETGNYTSLKLLRRLFYKFSNHYTSFENQTEKVEKYSEINYENYLNMIDFLGMIPEILSQNNSLELYRKITKNKDRKTMSFFNYLELIKKLSKKYSKFKRMNKRRLVLKNSVKRWSVLPNFKVPDKLIDQDPAGIELGKKSIIQEDTEEDEKKMRKEFLNQKIFPLRNKILMKLEIKLYEDLTFKNFFRNQEWIVKNLFLLACLQKKRDLDQKIDSLIAPFDYIFDTMTIIGLFPKLCSKSFIRQCYCYSQSMAEGLLIDDFKTFTLILGVGIVKDKQEERRLILKKLLEESTEEADKKEIEREMEEMSDFEDFSLIRKFFLNEEYLDSNGGLSKKLQEASDKI